MHSNMTDNNLASLPVDYIQKVRRLLVAGNALTSMPEVPPTVQILYATPDSPAHRTHVLLLGTSRATSSRASRTPP